MTFVIKVALIIYAVIGYISWRAWYNIEFSINTKSIKKNYPHFKKEPPVSQSLSFIILDNNKTGNRTNLPTDRR